MDKIKEIITKKEVSGFNLFLFYLIIQNFGITVASVLYDPVQFERQLIFLRANGIMDKFFSRAPDSDYSGQIPVNTNLMYYFGLLADTEDLELTAGKLNMTSQGLNKAISLIENSFHIKLVERDKNFIGLTTGGKVFLESSRKIIREIRDLDRSLFNLNPNQENGIPPVKEVKIFWSNFCYPDILSDAIIKVKEIYPDLKIKVFFDVVNRIENLVSSGEIDFGVSFKRPDDKYISFIKGRKIPYVILGKPQEITSRGKKWDELEFLDFPDIFGQNIKLSSEKKYPVKYIHYDTTLETALNLCEIGLGAIYAPESVVVQRLREGTLKIIAEPPENKFAEPFLIYNNSISLTPSLNLLLKEIEKRFV